MSTEDYLSPNVVHHRRFENSCHSSEVRIPQESFDNSTGTKFETSSQLTKFSERWHKPGGCNKMLIFNEEVPEDSTGFLKPDHKFSFYTEPSVNLYSLAKTTLDREHSETDCTSASNDVEENNLDSSDLDPSYKDVVQDQCMSEFGEKIVKYICSDDSDTDSLDESYVENDTELVTFGLTPTMWRSTSQERIKVENNSDDLPADMGTTHNASADDHYMLPAAQSVIPEINMQPQNILVGFRNDNDDLVRRFDEVRLINEQYFETVFVDVGNESEHDLGTKLCVFLDSAEEFAAQNREGFKQQLVSHASNIIGHINECLVSLEKTYCKFQIYDIMKDYVICARHQLNDMQQELQSHFSCQPHKTNRARKHPEHNLNIPQKSLGMYPRKSFNYQYHPNNKNTRPRKCSYTCGNNKSPRCSTDKTPYFVSKARNKTHVNHVFQKSASNAKLKQSHTRFNRKFSQHMFLAPAATGMSEPYCDRELSQDEGMIPTTIVSLRDEPSISSVSYSSMCIPPAPIADVLTGDDVDVMVKKKYLKTGTHFVPGRKSQHNSYHSCMNRTGHLVGYTKRTNNQSMVGRRRRDFMWREAQVKAEEKVKSSLNSTFADVESNKESNPRDRAAVNVDIDEPKESRSITKKNLTLEEDPQLPRPRQHISPLRQPLRILENGRGDSPITPTNNWLVQKNVCSTKRSKRRGINQEVNQKLEAILSSIWNMQESDFIITYEVSKGVPVYKYTNPMNLMEISSKLRRRIYENVEQMVHDFRRILFNVRLHYEDGQEKDIFYEHITAIGRKFDELLLENFNGCDYPQITGDPKELRTDGMLRYRVWDFDSE